MFDASILKTLATGGSGAAIPILVMFSMFTPQGSFDRHVAEARTGTVLDLVGALKQEPDGVLHDTLCNTLRAELAAICLDSDQHPFCEDRVMILADAGC